MLLNRLFIFSIIFSTYSAQAYIENCEISQVERLHLKMLDSGVVGERLSVLWPKKDLAQELEFYLTFEVPVVDVLGDTVLTCNRPQQIDLRKLQEISQKLNWSPLTLRKNLKDLIIRYPDELIVKSFLVNYAAMVNILDGYQSSQDASLQEYLAKFDKFKADFIERVQPNQIHSVEEFVTVGDEINYISQVIVGEAEKFSDDISKSLIRKLNHSGVILREKILRNPKSVYFINDSLKEYISLFSLGLSAETAASLIINEMKEKGHGYLERAIRAIKNSCEMQLNKIFL
ncbi:MAG: hypothetical protein H6625_08945 [Bdellovibrionaceae bacterium]|nr:hypothetical protein [Pseudobdellovibrionaceae bacterium]